MSFIDGLYINLHSFIVTGYPRELAQLAQHLHLPHLPNLVRRFLHCQYPNSDAESDSESNSEVDITDCPEYTGKIIIYPSAVATFFAPSDPSGMGGMCRERIRSVSSWRGGSARRDCVFADQDSSAVGFKALFVARVQLFFSLRIGRERLPCALVNWFSTVGDAPCPDTGMWMVEPDLDADGERVMDVVHLDTLVRGAHLIGVAGEDHIPRQLKESDSLDAFLSFYVNKYIDYHAHEIAF